MVRTAPQPPLFIPHNTALAWPALRVLLLICIVIVLLDYTALPCITVTALHFTTAYQPSHCLDSTAVDNTLPQPLPRPQLTSLLHTTTLSPDLRLGFFLEDDEQLADIGKKYASGELLTGEVKKILIGVLTVSTV